jgi:hypothetical protein
VLERSSATTVEHAQHRDKRRLDLELSAESRDGRAAAIHRVRLSVRRKPLKRFNVRSGTFVVGAGDLVIFNDASLLRIQLAWYSFPAIQG